MLVPSQTKIGDRVRDLVATKGGREQLGTVIEICDATKTVRIAWDWLTAIDRCYFTTWYLEPLDRPAVRDPQAWTPTPSSA